jgi:hypothetical protein
VLLPVQESVVLLDVHLVILLRSIIPQQLTNLLCTRDGSHHCNIQATAHLIIMSIIFC